MIWKTFLPGESREDNFMNCKSENGQPFNNRYSLNERPYDKFLYKGPESLTEAELLALIIRSGTKGHDAVRISEDVLKLSEFHKYGLNGLQRVNLEELMSVPGIGQVKAIKLKCLAELSVRMVMSAAKPKLKFNCPQSIAEYYMEYMRHRNTEIVLLLLLDSKMQLLEEHILSQGTANSSILLPRDVFEKALRAHSIFFILLHNHPSGDPSPSSEDIKITKKIKEAGELMEIKLMDHIIIGDKNYFSLKENEFI